MSNRNPQTPDDMASNLNEFLMYVGILCDFAENVSDRFDASVVIRNGDTKEVITLDELVKRTQEKKQAVITDICGCDADDL